ncbi:ABC transporter substrate-binding protein [Bradyrhizobium canariense]|uniref:Amino acid/amide ABC transporter substrate-binding protein, HAAT family n=1 Tax=Bradyrhizobium canariense TaxID=255045 RepID=A0A1H2AK21_9BRAD|nr:ABC transporter substrate-binding protein [Bradyrhizobium canariense]SDT46303.1 amino acid/amide ABC transporter substrate-binding protein, HAAT family [Bradyrhizobium canariense]
MDTRKAEKSRRMWIHRAALLAAVTLGYGAVRPAFADVKIGVLMPLSGKGASYGQHQEIAMKMALEELQKTGIKGEKVEAVVYDTRGENAEAITLTRKLIFNDKVLAIIGPFFSAECEVAFPIAVQGKIPIITASSAKPGIAGKNRPWAFRNALSSDQMNGFLLDTWLKRNPVKSVVILTDVKDAFTKVDGTVVFPAEFKEKGVNVLDNISYQTGDIDYSAQVTKAKGLNPEGILIAGLYNEGGNIVREIRKQGMAQPIVGALGMSETRFLDISGKAGDGTTVVNPFWPDDPDPKVHAWATEYQNRAKVAPGNTAALMYDTIFLAKNCIEKSGVTNKPEDLAADRERIRDCLAHVKDLSGITGPMSFDADGDAQLKPTVLVAKDGKWEAVK